MPEVEKRRPGFVVTGCAGFIGSHVAERLLSRGDAVIGIDNMEGGDPSGVREANLSGPAGYDGFEFHRADVRDAQAVAAALAGRSITAIIHLAALVGVRASIEDPRAYFDNNVLGTLSMLERARESGPEQFVLGSSSSVYGDSDRIPFSEDDRTDEPISPYAASKKACEILCYTYFHTYGVPSVCLRFFTVYGPRGRRDMAPFKFMDAVARGKPIEVFGDGKSERDYTYVDDIVSGVVAAADGRLGFDIINLGNSHPVPLDEFISAIEEVTGRAAVRVSLPEQPGDVHRTFADITKAGELLGYAPGTALPDGLKAMYDWYVAEGGGRA
jgi:UDP-glucuronate 4-epimerase